MVVDNDALEDIQSVVSAVCGQVEDMVQRTASLLSEYEQCNHLRQMRQTSVVIVGRKVLVQSVTAENLALKRALQELRSEAFVKDNNEEKRLATAKKVRTALQCSNVPALETAWDTVKRCRGLDRLWYRFSRHASVGKCQICAGKRKCPPKAQQDGKSIVWVDAVVDSGAEWLRVISIEERRLLLDMAQGGWDWDAGSESDSDGGIDGDESDISVVVTVRQLIEAAYANRHNYRPPRLHVVFTRVAEGSNSEIDKLLGQLRSMGKGGVDIRIDCSKSEFLVTPPPPLDIALQNLVADDLTEVTRTLNLDCSILVSLASDITHSHVDIQPWHRTYVAAQRRDEIENGSSLVKDLYPVLRSRKLVCTAQAAQRFRDIVATIGTKTEASRAGIILHIPGMAGRKTSEELLAEFRALSIHPVEFGLRFPIEVIDHDSPGQLTEAIETKRLPQIAEIIASDLTHLNKDIYLYGWMNGITTVTSNGTFAKHVVRLVEQNRTNNDEAGPKIWVFPSSRALATKGRPKRDSGGVLLKQSRAD